MHARQSWVCHHGVQTFPIGYKMPNKQTNQTKPQNKPQQPKKNQTKSNKIQTKEFSVFIFNIVHSLHIFQLNSWGKKMHLYQQLPILESSEAFMPFPFLLVSWW